MVPAFCFLYDYCYFRISKQTCNMKFKPVLTAIALLCICTALSAVPAKRGILRLAQPDAVPFFGRGKHRGRFIVSHQRSGKQHDERGQHGKAQQDAYAVPNKLSHGSHKRVHPKVPRSSRMNTDMTSAVSVAAVQSLSMLRRRNQLLNRCCKRNIFSCG